MRRRATCPPGTVRCYKISKSSLAVTLPTEIAKLVGTDRYWRVELDGSGILLRYAGEVYPTGEPPAWLDPRVRRVKS